MDTKSASIVGIIILGTIGIGLVLWYMTENPAPVVNHPTTDILGGAPAEIGPKTITESTKYYDIQATYPGTTPLKQSAGAQADAKAVEVMKQFELNAIAAFKEQGNFDKLTAEDIKMLGFDQGRKESLELTYQTKSGPKTVSYLFTLVQDTLGAHPNAYFRSFVYDLKSGNGLELGDIFTPGTNYYQILSTISRKKLPAVIALSEGSKRSDVDLGYMNRGTTADADNFQNWYIEGNSLMLVFPPYQVAPYSAGEQLVTIPFSELGNAVKTSYR
jgi:hypothetical protein